MQPDNRSIPRVAIAGGGLAGLTCAKVLADAGVPVTLVEAFPRLGGRASTFRDQDGDWIEFSRRCSGASTIAR